VSHSSLPSRRQSGGQQHRIIRHDQADARIREGARDQAPYSEVRYEEYQRGSFVLVNIENDGEL
jgi:hypothetical protein